MKKTAVITGLSIAALLGTGIMTYAEPTIEEIKAYLNHEVKIVYNGVQAPITPITYNDTTYVPVRSLSNLLDANVSWNGQKNAVEISPNKFLPLEEEQIQAMKAYGYTIEAPKLLDSIRFVVIRDIEDSISRGDLDKGTLSAVIIQYMVQDENSHKLHEDIATIEVFKKSDVQHIQEGTKIIAEKGDLVYIVKPSAKNPFDSSSNDYSNYESIALHLSNHSYYMKFLQDIEARSIPYENTAYHFTLKLPKTWEGKYDVIDRVVPSGNNIDFINKATKTGILFTVSVWTKEYWSANEEEIKGQIPITKVGEYGGNVYLFHTPTDVQYDPQDEKARADYLSMFKDVKTIQPTFEIKN